VLCSIIFLIGSLGRTRFWLALSALSLLVAQIGFALAFHRSLPAGRMGLIVTALFGTLLFRELKQEPSRKVIGTALVGVFLCFTVCFWIRFDLYPSIPGSSSPTVAPVNATCALASWMFAYLLFLGILALRRRTFPRIFIWVGQISYPLYVFHGLVLAVIPRHLPPLVQLAAVLAASLPIAHVVHILIEKPVGRFQHKLLRHSAIVVGPNPH
jgi:peptidoglycan/LPS O-acetylase OafA/YrhL